MFNRQPTKSVELEATITRADGTVEPQGVVAYYHRNPIKMFVMRRRHGIKGRVKLGKDARCA